MRYKQISNLFLLNFLAALFLAIGIGSLRDLGELARLNEDTLIKGAFRQQMLDETALNYIKEMKNPGEPLALYWLETNFGTFDTGTSLAREALPRLKQKWAVQDNWTAYLSACKGIWDDVEYFPIPEPSGTVDAKLSYVDSWMMERNYGGKRGHEGTDIMAERQERGFYPVVSMTDGVVRHKGWLEQGGWRLGIVAPGGAYFYYAHLDSYADIEVGDTVKAGDLLGLMGDSGYSTVEGTTGNFPVHLHLGIYIFYDEEEVSVNPYWVLRYIEGKRIQCVYRE